MPLLRIPPFPGSSPRSFSVPSVSPAPIDDTKLEQLIEFIRVSRAAGEYWGSQPSLFDRPYILARTKTVLTNADLAPHLPDVPIVRWVSPRGDGTRPSRSLSGSCDPWHLVEGAAEVIADADDELALIAAISRKAVRCVGDGPFAGVAQGRAGLLRVLRGPCLAGCSYTDPYTGKSIELAEAIEVSAFWRSLIDSNRPIKAAVGFAGWKKSTVAPLLWAGSGPVPFTSRPVRLQKGSEVAAWKSRVPQRQLTGLAEQGAQLVEVEDGFIRSIGLGADCVPPLSIVVDRTGIYFDPQQPSELEQLLEAGNFTEVMLDRARRLRKLIVTSGISKYQVGMGVGTTQPLDRGHLLVVGQVEDDRSVRCGGGPVQSNLELLRRARKGAPKAIIRYRPHPDVQAGHRVGAIDEVQLAGLANEVVASGTISEAIDAADEVHVNTSLAGFEALLRGRPVTTHGVPFYAGWGLTRDLGDVPARRTARRTLDELVAATLLQYPRYLDPVTGLPCPAETLVQRLAEGSSEPAGGVLVRLRQLQGRWKRGVSSLRQWVFK